jgi:hypothetical protein
MSRRLAWWNWLNAEACVALSVATKDDSYDNALDEKSNRLHKAELIQRCWPWKTKEATALATLGGFKSEVQHPGLQ